MLDLHERLDKLGELVLHEKTKVTVKETERLRLELEQDERNKDITVLLKVVEIFKTLGGETQEGLLKGLETFVTYGLQSVFGEDYRFVTKMGMEGKDIKVDFFIDTDELVSSVADAKGGGVAEVVSLLLQLFFIMVRNDMCAPVLILDTPMVHISEQFHFRVSGMLKELCEKFDLQVIMMVNANTYGEYADKVYRFTQEKGKTKVKEEK